MIYMKFWTMNLKDTLEIYTPLTPVFVHACVLMCVHTSGMYIRIFSYVLPAWIGGCDLMQRIDGCTIGTVRMSSIL